MSKDKDDRPATMEELAAAVRAISTVALKLQEDKKRLREALERIGRRAALKAGDNARRECGQILLIVRSALKETG